MASLGSSKKKAYFWIISDLQASNWSQIIFCVLQNILTSISERFGRNFRAKKPFADDNHRYGGLTLQNPPEGGYDEQS